VYQVRKLGDAAPGEMHQLLSENNAANVGEHAQRLVDAGHGR